MGMFDNLAGGENSNPMAVLSQFLNKDNIELKTDVSMPQIQVLTQLQVLSAIRSEIDKKENRKTLYEINKEGVKFYLEIMCSLDRQREKAIIEGLKEMKESLINIGDLQPSSRR